MKPPLKTFFLCLLAVWISSAQVKVELTTSKSSYAYGESIDARLTVRNDTTVPFPFFSSTSLYYWLRLDTVSWNFVALMMEVHDTLDVGERREYLYLLNPVDLGVPTFDGSHHLIAIWCGRLAEALFDAPMYRGGPLWLKLRPGMSSAARLSFLDSLHATVKSGYFTLDSSFVASLSIRDLQVDSLATVLSNDPRVASVSVERWGPSPRQVIITSAPGRADNPAQFTLDSNFPNPFNPATTIRFTIPTRTHVMLRVYDLLGRRVATLVDETLAAGVHSAVWNAHDVSSGIYIYRFEAGRFHAAKTMVVLK
jgi:hypothetical protein